MKLKSGALLRLQRPRLWLPVTVMRIGRAHRPPPKMLLRRSSSATSCTTDDFSSSQQSSKVQCADIVLSCLFCRIYDLIYNLPDSCQSFINHCCPAVQHLSSAVEPADSDDGDSLMAMDCGVFTSCHDASDCLELAMEISEICYH